MTLLQKISLKQIKNSKGRFWTTVIGVALSTAMMLSVLIGGDAGMDVLRRYVVGQNGNWHWSADRLPAQALSQLVDEKFSEQWGIFGGKMTTASTQGVPLCLYGVAGDFLEMMQTEITDGRLPKTTNELLVEKRFALKYGVSVGDITTITDEDGIQRETIIVGIFSHSVLNLQLPVIENGFNAFYGIDINQPLGEDVYRYFSAARQLDADYYTYTGNLGQSLLAGYPHSISFYQSTLITLSGMPGPDGTNRTLFFINMLRSGLLLVIAVASGMMIVNSFYISLSERKRTMGMLISVGATGNQATICLFYEALCVGAVGIPLGLFAGCGGLKLAFAILSPLMKSMEQVFGADFSLHIEIRPQWLFVSALSSLIVLLISAWLPARSFAKMSIIQTIFNSEEINVSHRVTHTGRLLGNILGIEAALAIKSAKRNYRRYIATVSSLTFCIALFIASAGLAQYVPKVNEANNDTEKYSLSLDYAVSKQDITQTQMYKALINPQTPVDKVIVSESIMLDMTDISVNAYTKENTRLANILNAYKDDEFYPSLIELNVVSDKDFYKTVGKDNAPDGTVCCILQNRYFYSTQSIVQTNFRARDTLQTSLNKMPITLYIASIDKSEYVQHRPGDATKLVFVVSQTSANMIIERLQQNKQYMLPRSIHISYQTDFPKDLKEEIELLGYNNRISSGADASLAGGSADYLIVSDNSADQIVSQCLNLILSVILYGFSGLIGLICICHVATTISTGLVLQRREFAMLQSLGMTEKALCKMILIQSAIHSLEALFWGVLFGLSLLWIEYSILRRLAGFLFTVPWWAVWVALLTAFAIAVLAAFPHLQALRKKTIMENLSSGI